MELTATLTKEQWEFILEVLDMNKTVQIKFTAITMLKTELDKDFNKKNVVFETKP